MASSHWWDLLNSRKDSVEIRLTKYVWRNTEASSCNHCCSGKAVSIAYSGCVFVDLGMQHVMRICHIVICGMPGCTIFFHIILWTALFFKKKKLFNIKCVFWFPLQLLYEKFLIPRTGRYDQKYIGRHVKYPLLLSDFNETWIFSTYFRKILDYQVSWKPVEWEPNFSTRTDGQTLRS